MKKILLTLVLAVIVVAGAVMLKERMNSNSIQTEQTDRMNTADRISTSTDMIAASTSSEQSAPAVSEPVKIIAEGLEIPWDMAFLPEAAGGGFLVTERPGRLVHISDEGVRSTIPVTGIKHTAEGGLLGLTLHPDFASNKLLYLYMSNPGQTGMTENKVARYRLDRNGDIYTLADEKIIIDKIPGAIYHDGGRMEFGPDGFLYITTGDATQSAIAQDLKSLGGKILRLKDDGSIPSDNPFGTAVYSYGHRNPQGLAWDAAGNLWETEHGRSGVTTGYDEINHIEKGKNYGWPIIEGPKTRTGMVSPVLQSGADDTWAPAGLVYMNDRLYFGGLRGETLYEANISTSSPTVLELKRHFFQTYGRIRTTRIGPDGMIYMMTSNRDGRGNPKPGDDKIIRINPASL